MATRLELTTSAGPALVELTRPRSATALLVLTHGAAGGVDSSDLVAVRDHCSAAGIAVALATQPYRVAGRKAPPTPARQDEAWLAMLAQLLDRPALRRLPLIVGGRSNGARVACRTAAATGAIAVVALAYPLHPPSHPERTRLPELEQAGVPVLVVQGSRDGFGTPPPGPGREVVVVEGADHSLARDTPLTAATVLGFVTAQLGRR